MGLYRDVYNTCVESEYLLSIVILDSLLRKLNLHVKIIYYLYLRFKYIMNKKKILIQNLISFSL